ncbi:TonB-dependent receptor [Endothiovibrio diazotrophicus]
MRAYSRTGYTSTLSDSASDQDNFGGNLQYTHPLFATVGGDHILTTGLDFRQGEVSREDHYFDGSNRLVKTSGGQRYAGLYLQDEWFLLDDALVLNLGGRYDYWHNYDGYSFDTFASPTASTFATDTSTSFNPKLAASYRLTAETTVRGSVGKAFRAPTLYDLYRTYIAGTTVYAPNPNLGAESVLAYELGLERRFGRSTDLSLSLYRNDAEDFISTLSVACTDPAFTRCYRKGNVGEVTTAGLEAELHHAIDDRWGLFANYTYSRSTVERYDPNPALEGNWLPDVPRHKGAFGLTYADPAGLSAKATVRHVGKRYSDDTNNTPYDGYTLVDLNLASSFGEGYRVSLEVNDLFDRGYTEYYVSPGRVVSAHLSIDF